ncbi:KR domain-containing protein, partial [Kitasatospora sp. NPDC058170]|uniref:KR domain-containing protein n=1 Tax=Kitasatospora sp. NPDC058170 TaxID=3346364 RepID=UPI0036DC7BA3
CDTTDPQALTHLLTTIPTTHPLTAVIHAAGVTADATLDSLTEEAFEQVLRPKAEAARHLHELTRELDLDAFVLFSSIAGVIGNAGQANYAAANTYLDALAQHRRALGLPASSLAWGLWAEQGGLGGALSSADLARIARTGVAPLGIEEGLALFDAALAAGPAATVPARLDLVALGASGDPGRVPPLLRGLVRGSAPAAATATDSAGVTDPAAARRPSGPDATPPWVRKLGEASEADRPRVALDLVRAVIAEVLGRPSGRPVPADRGLLDLGFDSLTAVDLRNRLGAETGLRLPTTLLFDHPTATALATHLRAELADRLPGGAAALLGRLDELEAALDGAPDDGTRERVTARLAAVLARLAPAAELPTELDLADDDELFRLIEGQLGSEE